MPIRSTKTKTDFDELLVPYLEGRLEKEEQAQFEKYLAESQAHRELVETLNKNTRMWVSYGKASANPDLVAPPGSLLWKTVEGWEKQSGFQKIFTKHNISLAGLGLVAGLAIVTVVVSSFLLTTSNSEHLTAPTVAAQLKITPNLPATLASTPISTLAPATVSTATPITANTTNPATVGATLLVNPTLPSSTPSNISPTSTPVLLLPLKAQPSGVVQWSPDGKFLAEVDYGEINNNGGELVYLWDAEGHFVATLKSHTSFITGVAWSPDSRTLATAGGTKDTTVRLWDTTGKEIKVLNQPSGTNSLMWSPDGQFLAVSMAGEATVNQIYIWKVSDSSLVGKIEPDQSSGGGAKIRWSPDGKMLAMQSGDGSVRLSDPTGKNIITLVKRFDDDTANSIEWSPDGKMLAVGMLKSIKLWSPEGKLLKSLADPQTGTYMLSWSPDSKLLAAIGADGKHLDKVFMWNVTQASLFKTLDYTAESLVDLTWSPNGKILAVSSAMKSPFVKLYSDSGELLNQINTNRTDTGTVYLAWSPDGRTLTSRMTVAQTTLVQLWTPQGKAITTFTNPEALLPESTPTTNPTQPTTTPNPQGHTEETILLFDLPMTQSR